MDCLIPTLVALVVLGPGVLAPADALVLERVEVRRVQHGWGLDEFAPVGTVRVATESCDYLGFDGLIVVDDAHYPARVVDCQRRTEEPRLSELGILADVSDAELGHRRAYLILWE